MFLNTGGVQSKPNGHFWATCAFRREGAGGGHKTSRIHVFSKKNAGSNGSTAGGFGAGFSHRGRDDGSWSPKLPQITVCALIFLVKIGKLSHSRTKRLVSALPKSTLFTTVPFETRSTLKQFGHLGNTMKIIRYLLCVRSPLSETLANSVQISFPFGRTMK